MNAIEHRDDPRKAAGLFAARRRQIREIELEEVLRRDAAFINQRTNGPGPIRGECTVDTIVERVGHPENWHLRRHRRRSQCWAGLEDLPCGRLRTCKGCVRAARRGCVHIKPNVPSTVARPPALLEEVHFDQKSHAPSYADVLLYAPPAPLETPPDTIHKWTVPRAGVAAKLAEEATAAWRQWGYDEGAVEAAASDPDCLLQVLSGEVGSRTKP